MTVNDLASLFTTFQRSAFRLEAVGTYLIESEAESLRLFREGLPPPAWRRDRPWLQTVRDATAAGKVMQRVRVIRGSMTEYQRFECEWGYPDNEQAGEDIRILELAAGDELTGMADHDFWLFDDTIVVRLEYDESGRFLRPVAMSDPAPYRDCRDVAMARAVAFRQYRATLAAR